MSLLINADRKFYNESSDLAIMCAKFFIKWDRFARIHGQILDDEIIIHRGGYLISIKRDNLNKRRSE